MNKIDDLSRFGGSIDRFAEYEWSLSARRLLPRDFPERLVRLKEASGLTWSGMARAIGIDPRQMREWRRGAQPSGGAYHSLVLFAAQIDGGLEILMGEGFQGFQMTLFEEES